MINFKKIQPVLISLLFMIGSALLLWWMTSTTSGYGGDLYDRMQTIANQQIFEKQYNELVAIVEETKDERLVLEEFVLNDETDTIELLSKIDEIKDDQKVELSTRVLSVMEKDTTYNDLLASFSMSGTERSVTKMILMFETLPYHGRVTDLSINRTENEETGYMEVNADVTLLLSIKKYD